MTDFDAYFESLQQRKRAGLWYRNLWLYPRICRYLHGRVVDIGCGIGDMVRFRRDTIGVDVNPKAVAFCLSQGLKVELMQPDQLPFPDAAFDGAVLDNVLEHLEEPTALLAETRRVLVPGGTLIAGVPGRRGFASDWDHKHHYPEAELVRCLQAAGFGLLYVFHQPFRSGFLDRHFRYYAIYGVFRRS